MSAIAFNSFLADDLSLPIEQRSRLATVLIDSLDMDEDTPLSQAWKTEVTRRSRELTDGSVQPMSLDQFRDFIEQRVA